jgi:hypothetical protein
VTTLSKCNSFWQEIMVSVSKIIVKKCTKFFMQGFYMPINLQLLK